MNQFKKYNPEQLEEHLSNYLINSWSYSKVTTFARNEKAMEMQYIYGLYGRKSATSVAGNAYHEALRWYFQNKQQGKEIDLVELEQAAFEYIDNIPPNDWKLQKTTPTIEACVTKATATANALLKNFMVEKAIYEDDIDKVLDVELRIEDWVTVNGVDIPLPCHMVIDLVVKTKAGNIAIVDHKSKSVYTDEEEIALSIGVQAITYVLGYEARTGKTVNEVWFVENKHSQNKDKSPQLHKNAVTMDKDTRRLYEAILYEPLKRMIEAVSDPNYVYLINESDNLVDKAELYDFWARTMISEVEDFNVEESKKALVAHRLRKIRDAASATVTPQVIKKFKENASKFIQYDLSNANMTAQEKIEHVLRSFNMPVQVTHTHEGYSSTTYLLSISAGIKVAAIHSHKLDLANALDVSSVRVTSNLIVYEGKSYLGIEISKKREKDLLWDKKLIHGTTIPIGVDNYGNYITWNLTNQSAPHMLVCGATGSGKSVFLNSTIHYALASKEVKHVYVFDPKFEFRHLGKHTTVCNEIGEIEGMLAMLVEKMNNMVRVGKSELTLIVFDEFADAVAQSKGKTLEENLRILLQKGRSSGLRIIAATQRASVKVITGDAKANFPVQVCFRVPKEIDSRVVIDEPGAESLAGKGDGLIKSPEYDETVRFQAFYKP